MWSLVLTLALAAHSPSRAPAPRAQPGASFVLFAPKLAGVAGPEKFLTRASAHAPLLGPGQWVAQLHPLVRVDPARTDLLEAAGIDPNGPYTLSVKGDLELVCLRMKDPSRFQQVADLALGSFGAISRARRGHAVIHQAGADSGRELGWVSLGKTSCTAQGPNARALLREVAGWLESAHWPKGAGGVAPSGTLRIRWHDVEAGLASDGKTLTLDARLHTARPLLARKGPATFPVPPTGLLRASVHVSPRAFARQLAFGLGRVSWHAHRMRRPLEVTLGGQLTGQLLLRVDRLELKRGLSRWRGRLSAPRWAALAQVKDPVSLQKALAAQLPPARPDGTWHFAFRGAEFALGLEGQWLWVANDPLARTRLLRGEARPGTSSASYTGSHPERSVRLERRHAVAESQGQRSPRRHALEVMLDPSAAAASLGAVNLLDSLRSVRGALWLAGASQAAGVLEDTGALSAWADRTPRGLRVHARWTLR